jgi:hypothetical protein
VVFAFSACPSFHHATKNGHALSKVNDHFDIFKGPETHPLKWTSLIRTGNFVEIMIVVLKLQEILKGIRGRTDIVAASFCWGNFPLKL